MSTTWQSVNKFDFTPSESPELFKQFCDLLNLEQYTPSSFHERLFRHGTFRDHDYGFPSFPTNKIMTHPFCDHCYYFRTKKDLEGNRIIYFVSQPYLTNEECKDFWDEYLCEEKIVIQKVLKYNHGYKAPFLDCTILGKDKSFHYPTNSNLIVIGLATDIQKIKIK